MPVMEVHKRQADPGKGLTSLEGCGYPEGPQTERTPRWLYVVVFILFAMAMAIPLVTFIHCLIEHAEFRDDVKSLYEWPLVVLGGDAGSGWERYFLLFLLRSFLVMGIVFAVSLVVMVMELIAKEAGSSKRQNREHVGQGSDKEVSEVQGRISEYDNQPWRFPRGGLR
ncbi:hypothetical protein E8E11_003583 [Didymella keratinophila]|nr:hypothetical protein E8E11_003583 [Didymella keratinophila]